MTRSRDRSLDGEAGEAGEASPPTVSIDARASSLVVQRSFEERRFEAATPIRLGRFSILEALGRGGMGEVYSAYDPDLDRRIALKLVRAQGSSGPRGTERLLREAKALAKLSHPAVITVHEVGVHEGQVFIAMEFAPGGTLAQWAATLDDDPLRLARLLDRMRECIEGLAAAHEAGLIHRDFKPSNVLIGADGRARVADFGLARTHGLGDGPSPLVDPGRVEAQTPSRVPGADLDARLTPPTHVVGTPAYMAPEQFRGDADARSDQFALCVAFFEVLYGERPFAGRTPEALLARIEGGAIHRPASRRDVPESIYALLSQGLRANPDRRFASMRALGSALQQARRPRRRLGPVLGAVGISTAAIVLAWPDAEPTPTTAGGSQCTDGQELLLEAWGPERQAAIRAAFEATKQSAWPGLWERVQSRFDQWAHHWRDAYRSSCEATRVHGTQSEPMFELRALCLDRQRRRFATLSANYASVDPKSIYDTSKSSLLLPRIEECAEREALVFGDGAADLSSPAVTAHFDALDRGMDLAREHRDPEAEPYVREAATIAEDAGLFGLASSAWRGMSTLAFRRGDYEQAGSWALRALRSAERSGDGEQIVWAWHRLATIARATERADDESFYFERAMANAKGFEVPDEVRASLMGFESELQMRAGNTTEAVRLLLDAADLKHQLGLGQESVCEQLMDAVGPLQLSGDTPRAIEVAHRATAIAEELFGPSDPLSLTGRAHLIQLFRMQGKHTEALEQSSLAVANLPPRGVMQDRSRFTLMGLHAIALHRVGRSDEAIGFFADVVLQARAALGPDSSVVLTLREQHATILLEQGRLKEALLEYEVLAPAYANNPAVLPIQRAGLLLNYAETLAKLDRSDAAMKQLDEALPIFRRVTDPKSPWRFKAIHGAGGIALRAGHREAARALFEECVETGTLGDNEPALVESARRQLDELTSR